MEDFSSETPLAKELHRVVQPKLQECGWTTGGDDTTLFDYILLMLANDKNEAQVASELSNDLLDLGPENVETQQFSRWLFEQIEVLRNQLNGGHGSANSQTANMADNRPADVSTDASANAQDMEMEGVTETSSGTIPTGPKAMRNGSGAKTARGGRMLNQMNKSMGRQDDSALHRVRGGQNAGRINSHSRDTPKGPRGGANVARGLDALANGRGMNNMNMVPGGMNGMNGGNMGAMPGMSMSGMGQPGMPGMLNPSQQMALMQMYEQQATMMQQIFSGQVPQPFVNPNFGRGGKKFSGSNRGGGVNKQGMHQSSKFSKKDGQDENMADGANGDAMETETQGSRLDPSTTMCNFNQRCAKADCPFVHSSPAAPKTTVVDMNTTCTFGAACKNNKCAGKHPSPAQRAQYQAEQECMFWPNCRDQNNCPYSHPTAPPCRNGADCTTPGCTFHHSKIVCKYNPCTKPNCHYKHSEGQKKNAIKSHVWVANKNGEGEHVSERKFVDESKEEELLLPEKPQQNTEVHNTEMQEAGTA